MNVNNESTNVNTLVTPVIQNMQNEQSSLSSSVKKNRRGQVRIFKLFIILNPERKEECKVYLLISFILEK